MVKVSEVEFVGNNHALPAAEDATRYRQFWAIGGKFNPTSWNSTAGARRVLPRLGFLGVRSRPK